MSNSDFTPRTQVIRAIGARYKGYHFRSRLEGRYAVLFDALGLKWEYEPEGYDLGFGTWYLPDFLVHGLDRRDYWVEVKGVEPTREEGRKLMALCDATGRGGCVLVGTPGDRTGNAAYGYRSGKRYLWVQELDCCDLMYEGLGYSAYSERSGRDGHYEYHAALDNAVAKARAARFEHGRSGS